VFLLSDRAADDADGIPVAMLANYCSDRCTVLAVAANYIYIYIYSAMRYKHMPRKLRKYSEVYQPLIMDGWTRATNSALTSTTARQLANKKSACMQSCSLSLALHHSPGSSNDPPPVNLSISSKAPTRPIDCTIRRRE